MSTYSESEFVQSNNSIITTSVFYTLFNGIHVLDQSIGSNILLVCWLFIKHVPNDHIVVPL